VGLTLPRQSTIEELDAPLAEIPVEKVEEIPIPVPASTIVETQHHVERIE